MIAIGNFFFRHRNTLFIFLYLLLFVPSPPIFGQGTFGVNYWLWPVITGLIVTITGELIRGGTIGLAYIVRGGKNNRIAADDLVTEGIFRHCRNPLYVGNILMLTGVGILSNSVIYLALVIPFFLFIYQSIVLAEENFLLGQFGDSYKAYCNKTNRWVPSLKGLGNTFRSMRFNWRRWLLKEYNTQYIWLSGITLILLIKYPQVTDSDTYLRNLLLAVILPLLLLLYLFVRYLKKSRRLVE